MRVASVTGGLDAAGKHVRVVATSPIVTGPLEPTGLLDRLDVTGMPTSGPDGDGGPPRRARPADPQAMHGATASATMGGGGDTAGQEENT